MKKIGIIFGMESTFPPALVDKINSFHDPEVQAELASIGEVRMAEPSPYDVIIDRISHDIPFYRGYLKNAALSGSIIINNPFWWSADDKFFNFALGPSWAWPSPRPFCCPTNTIRRAPPIAPCATCNIPCPGTPSLATSAFPRSSSPSTGAAGEMCTRYVRRKSSSRPTTRHAISA